MCLTVPGSLAICGQMCDPNNRPSPTELDRSLTGSAAEILPVPEEVTLHPVGWLFTWAIWAPSCKVNYQSCNSSNPYW